MIIMNIGEYTDNLKKLRIDIQSSRKKKNLYRQPAYILTHINKHKHTDTDTDANTQTAYVCACFVT